MDPYSIATNRLALKLLKPWATLSSMSQNCGRLPGTVELSIHPFLLSSPCHSCFQCLTIGSSLFSRLRFRVPGMLRFVTSSRQTVQVHSFSLLSVSAGNSTESTPMAVLPTPTGPVPLTRNQERRKTRTLVKVTQTLPPTILSQDVQQGHWCQGSHRHHHHQGLSSSSKWSTKPTLHTTPVQESHRYSQGN